MTVSIRDAIEKIRRTFQEEIETLEPTEAALEKVRIRYLGRKGEVSRLFPRLAEEPEESRRQLGKALNTLKTDLRRTLADLAKRIPGPPPGTEKGVRDSTLPGDFVPVGSLHPIEHTLREVKEIFTAAGFSVAYGPEVDDDYHNFEALNIPRHHPARDMQDTFYVSRDVVLRTHTSNTQIHVMERRDPPVRIIVPGRVYRNEAISVRSYCVFHQVEGLYVNQNVSFAELKGTMEYFVRRFFGPGTRSRFRPSYFPFTEPSAEVDVSCFLCSGKGCTTCKKTGWLEILGCGMVDPAVFQAVGYDPRKWTGYAFGIGIERMAMLKYQIEDIRLFFTGDVRFLRQFR
ncbi:MAG: phenylalanine--tRNA ligase subunit alpha [Fidelibacterota bacterium]